MNKADWDSYAPSTPQQNQLDALLALLRICGERDLRLTVIGGYGVDALYGKLTRDHHDFDIVVHVEDEPALRSILADLGYRQAPTWSEPGRKDVFQHAVLGGDFVLELATLDESRMAMVAAQLGREVDWKSIFPAEPNGHLQDVAFCAPTIEGVELINQIQRLTGLERGWDEFIHKEHQEALLDYLRTANGP